MEKLLGRATHNTQVLLDYLDDHGDKLYQGRTLAALCILEQIGRDRRRHLAETKQALRRRRALRAKPPQEVHERM